MIIKNLKYWLVLLSLAFVSAPSSAQTPEELIKNTADVVLADIAVNLQDYKKSPSALYTFVEKTVLQHFDFERMTNLALGRYKRKATSSQKKQMETEFRALLVRTYSKALLEYEDQQLIYLPSKGSVAKGDVTVRTEIDQPGGFPIPIYYKLYKVGEHWKVYDLSVDNVSLVTNYRSSFSREIKKNGIDGLIKSLRERNNDA